MVHVLVTGAGGFVGQNLVIRLNELANVTVEIFDRTKTNEELQRLVAESDVVFHLAGVNRPRCKDAFHSDNVDLTSCLVDSIAEVSSGTGKHIKLFFTSSTQVERNNAYGISKLKCEEHIRKLKRIPSVQYQILRLPNVFGKWCKPEYNSFVATFCHNIANELPIVINDRCKKVSLLYIDDLIDFWFWKLNWSDKSDLSFDTSFPRVYETTVGRVAEILRTFHKGRLDLHASRVGCGLSRALYATYLSYLPADLYTYRLKTNKDQRGLFAEFLKTEDSGQFSFFTVLPGKTRGGHYHHTKVEKFLVVEGKIRFSFQSVRDGAKIELETNSDNLEVVETIPGYAHTLENPCSSKAIVLCWANEVFENEYPDTYRLE